MSVKSYPLYQFKFFAKVSSYNLSHVRIAGFVDFDCSKQLKTLLVQIFRSEDKATRV